MEGILIPFAEFCDKFNQYILQLDVNDESTRKDTVSVDGIIKIPGLKITPVTIKLSTDIVIEARFDRLSGEVELVNYDDHKSYLGNYLKTEKNKSELIYQFYPGHYKIPSIESLCGNNIMFVPLNIYANSIDIYDRDGIQMDMVKIV